MNLIFKMNILSMIEKSSCDDLNFFFINNRIYFVLSLII